MVGWWHQLHGCVLQLGMNFLHCGSVEVFPIELQPQKDVVLLGQVPAGHIAALRILRIPICVQVAGRHRTTFLELCAGRMSLADVQESVGQLWPEGGKVYVGDSSGDFFTPTVGLLVRVLPPHSRPLRVDSADEVLQQPQRLRQITSDAWHDTIDDGNAVGFLRLGACAGFLDMPPHTPLPAIKCRIGEVCGLTRNDFTCHRPCVSLPDLEILGKSVEGLVGVLPDCLHLAQLAFVDARDLGKPVTVIALPPDPFPLTAVLGILGVERPADMTFEIHGARRLVGNAEGFMPRDDMVILLDRLYALTLMFRSALLVGGWATSTFPQLILMTLMRGCIAHPASRILSPLLLYATGVSLRPLRLLILPCL